MSTGYKIKGYDFDDVFEPVMPGYSTISFPNPYYYPSMVYMKRLTGASPNISGSSFYYGINSSAIDAQDLWDVDSLIEGALVAKNLMDYSSTLKGGLTNTETVVGLKVAAVANGAFRTGVRLASVRFPICTSIGISAFAECSSLTSVDAPQCQSIEGMAFEGCIQLSEANFPSCTSVKFRAFSNCQALSSVNIPLLTRIEQGTFYSCHSLASASFPICKTVKNTAFGYCRGLSEITLPAVEMLGTDAFRGCKSLSSISLPLCESIEWGAFLGCDSLTSASIPNVRVLGSLAFASCEALTEIDCPLCSEIGSAAFQECSALTKVLLPSCEHVGSYAFRSCWNLNYIDLPACISIGDNAFLNCSPGWVYLKEYGKNTGEFFSQTLLRGMDVSNIRNLTLGFSKIGDNAFSNMELDALDLPNFVGDVGDMSSYAFDAADVEMLYIDNCLSGGQSLPGYRLVLYNSIYDYIASNAFTSWAGGRVSAPYATSVGSSAFSNCLNLRSATLPNVSILGNNAFYSCTNLRNISIPACTSIGGTAFMYCSNLEELSLPNTTFIGLGALVRCSNLTDLYIGTSNCSLEGFLYGFDIYSTTIHVPSAYVEWYKTASTWSAYSSYIVGDYT